jgi:hypothetical protein
MPEVACELLNETDTTAVKSDLFLEISIGRCYRFSASVKLSYGVEKNWIVYAKSSSTRAIYSGRIGAWKTEFY